MRFLKYLIELWATSNNLHLKLQAFLVIRRICKNTEPQEVDKLFRVIRNLTICIHCRNQIRVESVRCILWERETYFLEKLWVNHFHDQLFRKIHWFENN